MVLLAGISVAVTVYTNVLWFREVKFSTVYRTQVWTQLLLWVVFGTVFAGSLLLNAWLPRRLTDPARASMVPEAVLEGYRRIVRPYRRWALSLGAIALAVIGGASAAAKWQQYLLWRHAAAFPDADPVFHKNLGFYIFKLPWLQFAYGWAFGLLVASLVLAVIAHYVRGGIRPQNRGDRFGPAARAHLSALLGLIVLLKAWGYRLGQYRLLFSKRGVVPGAGYTDVHAQLPLYRALVILAIVCAALLLANVRTRNWRMPVAAISLLLVAGLASSIYPNAVQRFKVRPDERALEAPFLARNIAATRAAFGVEAVKRVSYGAGGTLDAAAATANAATIANIRVWSPDVLQTVYQNLQRTKQYYKFVGPADVDRYATGTARSQVMIAAREISSNGLSPEAKTWLNTHLFYTHGYGVVASDAGSETSQGQPTFLLANIPPSGSPALDVPQIYFGESQEVPFVVAGSKQEELDYPSTTNAVGYVTTHYDGTGGIKLGGFWKRLAFAWRFRDLNVVLSGAIDGDSRIIFLRQVYNRVAQVAPFLTIDADPYVAVAGGRPVWILDGYTTSSMYPYSQVAPFGGGKRTFVAGSGNYIRDAVKFVVDAKNGTIDAYVWDESDPVLHAWRTIFPRIFKDRTAMPADLRAHVRYPEGLFQAQSDRYANYHVTDPGAFYQKEDAWLVGRDPTWCLNNSGACAKSGPPPVTPYYMLVQLPGTAGPEFVIVRPFTPGGSGRQNMVAYLVAHGDPNDYGTMVEYDFPRSQEIFGPEQIEANINQDPVVSQQVSLWNQQHSRVIYGNLLIVPVADTLLYVQPLYLQSEGSQIPELKRVVVSAGGDVAMASSLDDALRLLTGRA